MSVKENFVVCINSTLVDMSYSAIQKKKNLKSEKYSNSVYFD